MLHSVRDVLRITRLSRSVYYRLRQAGDFPQPVKIGNAVMHRGDDVTRWLAERRASLTL